LQRKLIRRLVICAAIASPFAGAAVTARAEGTYRGTQLCAKVGVGDTPKDQPPAVEGPCVTPPPETGEWGIYCGDSHTWKEVGPDHTVHVAAAFCYGYPI
jgi:hypothetical protein